MSTLAQLIALATSLSDSPDKSDALLKLRFARAALPTATGITEKDRAKALAAIKKAITRLERTHGKTKTS